MLVIIYNKGFMLEPAYIGNIDISPCRNRCVLSYSSLNHVTPTHFAKQVQQPNRKTRKKFFFLAIEWVMPWGSTWAVIEPFYPN